MDIDPLLLPYVCGNEPVPPDLNPLLEEQLQTSSSRISACEVLISEAQATIWEYQRKVQALKKEIEKLREEMWQHDETKNKISTVRRKLTNTTLVIRRIPPEIIASILEFAARDKHGSVQAHWILRLCAVSRLWRNTGLSTPTLWRTLVVELDRFSSDRSRQSARALFNKSLSQWFSRCGEGASADLTFHPGRLPMICQPDASLQARDVVDWIRSCNFSFASLTLQSILSSTTDVQHLFSINSSTALRATKALFLEIPTLPPSSTPPTRPSIQVKAAMPSLERLRLSASDGSDLSFLFSHATPTKLALEEVTLRTWCIPNLLRGLPALQSLSLLHCYRPRSRQGQAFQRERQTILVHQSLRKILLTGPIHGQFFHRIVCPTLERVELRTDAALPSSSGLTLSSARLLGELIQRSGPSNVTLHLGVQLPTDSLNVLVSISSPHVKTVELGSLGCLPLRLIEENILLVLPRSIQRVQCSLKIWEEVLDWRQRLASCLEDPTSQVLDVQRV